MTAMNSPNTAIAAISAATGIAMASAAGPSLIAGEELTALSHLADHALDQIIHAFQRRLGLLVRSAGGDDDFAGVVLERALEDRVFTLFHFCLNAVGLLARRFRHGLAVRRHFHVT